MSLLRKIDDIKFLMKLKTVGRWILTWTKTVEQWIQTLSYNILSKNPDSTVVKGAKLLDPYLNEFLLKQDKRIPLGQDKSLANLQQKICFVYGPLCRIWSAIEVEKESCPSEEISDDQQLSGIYDLADQLVPLHKK